MPSKFHGGDRTKDRMTAFYYATYVTPNLMASFALTLYDKTDMSKDDIKEMLVDVQELWDRSTREGWDIKENCRELLDIDVRHWIEEREHSKKGNKFTGGDAE
jgi:hypothetical protein